jgi:sulfur-oxidizing protein SoxY
MTLRSASLPSRRQALAAAGFGAVAVALVPRLALAEPKDVEAEIKKIVGDKKPAAGRVKFDAPAIAENGNVVPVKVMVESPMTADDHVKSVHIFADGNPLPGVVAYHFTPASGRAQAECRIRLAKTQNLVAVAETSKGEFFQASTEIKVTIGGCGG